MRGAFAAAQRLRPGARRERAALPGAPMARRAGGGKSAGWPAGGWPVFRRYMDVPSKNPVTRPRTRRAGGPEGAPSGWPSLWVTFLLATQEKSNSGAGRRSKTLCRLRQGGQGHPTPALPCMQGRELPVAASRAAAPHPTLSSLLHAERAQGCARLWGARKAAAIHGRSPRAPKGRGLQAALTSANRSVRSSFRVVTGLSSTCRRGSGGSSSRWGGASGRTSITTALS